MNSSHQDLRPLRPVDIAREGVTTRFIYWFFDRVERACTFAIEASPTWRALDAERLEAEREIAEHAKLMRAKYPEDFAEADRQMRRRYFHLDE